MNKQNSATEPAGVTPDQLNKNDAFVCYAIATAAYLVASAVFGSIQSVVTEGGAVWWLCLAAANLSVGISALLYLRRKGQNPWRTVTFDVAPNAVHTIVCCVCVVGLLFFMSPVTDWLYDLMEQWGFKRPSVDLPRQFVPLLLTATFLPAVCEEFALRGVVAQGLLGGRNKAGAVVLSGALFALFHANPAQTLHQFFIGCLLAVLLLKSGSLWCCVIVHFVNNFAVVAGEFCLPESVYTSPVACIVGGVVAVATFAAYILFVKPTNKSLLRRENLDVAVEPIAAIAFAAAVVIFAILWVAAL